MFQSNDRPTHRLSRSDEDNPLSSFSAHSIELDEDQWPSVEHYYQGMKFENADIRESIRSASDPRTAQKTAKQHKRAIRQDWPKIRTIIMTRGMYIKCRTHPNIAKALLKTGRDHIIETSQYDYFWGCGRDGLGDNEFGKLLMGIREKLQEERNQQS